MFGLQEIKNIQEAVAKGKKVNEVIKTRLELI